MLDEPLRFRPVHEILAETEDDAPEASREVRGLLSGSARASTAAIPHGSWNAERLNKLLVETDGAVAVGQYERAVTLAYTTLEGFLGAFVRAASGEDDAPKELIALARRARELLKDVARDCPDEGLHLLTQHAHTVDRARNRFSESHFDGEAERWLATFVRDIVNTEVRLLHFL